MENHDYLMKQFDALGEALRKLLAKVSLFKESGATDIQVAELSNVMKSGIGLNLHDIADLTNEAFLADLLEQKLKPADLSLVVNLLVELAKVKNGLPDQYNSSQLLSKALFLGDYLTTNQNTAYFGTIMALDEAKKLLNKE